MVGDYGQLHICKPQQLQLAGGRDNIRLTRLSKSETTVMGSRQHVRDIKSGPPLHYADDIRAYKKEYAEALDAQDPLRSFRDEFIIPSKNDLKRKTLAFDEGKYQTSALGHLLRISSCLLLSRK
jgi:hypothetical protein